MGETRGEACVFHIDMTVSLNQLSSLMNFLHSQVEKLQSTSVLANEATFESMLAQRKKVLSSRKKSPT